MAFHGPIFEARGDEIHGGSEDDLVKESMKSIEK
jgi:hypothetical protein